MNPENGVWAVIGAAAGTLGTKLIDMLIARQKGQMDDQATFRLELRQRVKDLEDKLAAVEERNDVLVLENARLDGQARHQAAQLETMSTALKSLTDERNALRDRVRELEREVHEMYRGRTKPLGPLGPLGGGDEGEEPQW